MLSNAFLSSVILLLEPIEPVLSSSERELELLDAPFDLGVHGKIETSFPMILVKVVATLPVASTASRKVLSCGV